MNSSLFSNITVILYQYIGIPLYILGNLGNIFCLLIFSQKTWRKNVCVFYFLVCLVVDCIYINVNLLGSIFILGFKIDLTSSNRALCKIYSYLSLLLSTLSSTILLMASIDRLFLSSQNVDTRLYSSRRLAYLLISCSSTFWLIYFVHVLIKFDVEQFGIMGSICFFNAMDVYVHFIGYSMLVINILSFLLLILLSALSFKNVRQIRPIPHRERRTIRAMHKKDFQILRCLFAKNIIYILCNAFLCLSFIYKSIPQFRLQTVWQQLLDGFLFDFGTLIHYIPFCFNLYIYISVSQAFRQTFKRSIWRILGKDLTDIQGIKVEERVVRESNMISTIIL